MIEFIKALLEGLKLGPRHYVAISVFTGVLLFCDPDLLERIALRDFAEDYRTVLGFAFVAACTLVAVGLGSGVLARVGGWWRQRKFQGEVLQRLQCLTEDEKQILRFYVVHQTKTNTLRVNDGVVNGLVASGILYRAAAVGDLVQGFAHNLSEEAWQYLQIDPSVLDGNTNRVRTDKSTWRDQGY